MAATFQVNTLSGGSLTTGLVNYWKLNSNSNSFFGTTNNGTDSNMAYNATGHVGATAASFVAANSPKIDLTDVGFQTGSGARSMAFWVNYTTLPTSGNQMVNFVYGTAAVNKAMFLYQQNSAGTEKATIDVFGAAGQVNNTPGTAAWHFMIYTFSGTTMTVYQDDPTTALGTATINSVNTTLNNVAAFGYDRLSGGSSLNGAMEQFGIWNKVLSQNERLDLWNGGAGQTMVNPTPAGAAFLLNFI